MRFLKENSSYITNEILSNLQESLRVIISCLYIKCVTMQYITLGSFIGFSDNKKNTLLKSAAVYLVRSSPRGEIYV
jgi:hypothetical protein